MTIPQEVLELFAPEDLAEIEAEKTAKKAPPPCPKCGNEMALRTAKQGPFAGTQFYGCTKFPQCNGIRNTDNSPRLKWCCLCGERSLDTVTLKYDPKPETKSEEEDPWKKEVLKFAKSISQPYPVGFTKVICKHCADMITVARVEPPNLIEFVLG